ncbi:unnamed protein product [Meloidogyne enterolobii]|uniref:Uncharacterized protein n=1 Tax=Meloidogyne enterolobii TaxID=390850 RepID=A0ACB0ZRN6_MELEN
MLEEPISPLTFLSISAIITTISLFFCGIPICIQIYRRNSAKDISGFPFLMGFLGGSFWLRYGFLKSDLTMITVNVVGVTLMIFYLMFYFYYSQPKTNFLIVFSIIVIMLGLVDVYKIESLQPLGFVSMTFNILNFGAPLAGLNVVLRNRSCSTLPLPLCIANLLVSSQWCLYGIYVRDIYVIIPNSAGILLACVQISLFLVLPPNDRSHAPLAKCCPCVLDLEKGEILESENSSRQRRRKGHQKKAKRIHSKLPCKKLLERHYIIDSRVIPASRAACIEYFRGGYGRPFDASFGSVNSRSTADSWLTNSLSRVSSISHPDLFNSEIYKEAHNNGARNKIVVEVLTNDEMQQQQQHHKRHHCHSNCGGSLLHSRTSMYISQEQPSTSQIYSNNQQQDEGFASSSAALSISSRPTIGFDTAEYSGENGLRMLNGDKQLLTESDPGGGNYLLCRTLSAPDLQQIMERTFRS